VNGTFSGHSDAAAFIRWETLEWTAMTRSHHDVGDLNFASRPTKMTDGDYEGYEKSGWRQLLCAWFIVLAFAMLFKFMDSIAADQMASFARATDQARTADTELAAEIEQWERGVPRQWTTTVPRSRGSELVASRAEP
jgi:hypothetical protein